MAANPVRSRAAMAFAARRSACHAPSNVERVSPGRHAPRRGPTRGFTPYPYDRVMAVVLILLAIVVVLVVVIAGLAIGGQRSRAKPGDEGWQEKVREEYEPRGWDDDD